MRRWRSCLELTDVAIGVFALAVSIWCSYVGLTAPNLGAASVGWLCVVASLWLIVQAVRGR